MNRYRVFLGAVLYSVLYWLVLMGVLSFVFPIAGWSEVVETVEQHLKRADSYGVMTEFAKADIRSYKREKENYAKRPGPSASRQAEERIKEYNELIAEEEALLADFKLLEKWHRTRTKALEGD